MEKSKILFQNARGFSKGKYLDLFLIALVPLVVAIVYELFNFGSSFLDTSAVAVALSIYALLFVIKSIQMIISFVTPFAFINYIDTRYKEKTLSAFASYKLGWKKFARGLLLRIVLVLLVLLGVLVFIVPGIYFVIIFSFALYVYMIREKGIKESLAYSFYLIEKRMLLLIKKLLYGVARVVLPGLIALLALALSLVMGMRIFEGGNITTTLVLVLIPFLVFLYFFVVSFKTSLAYNSYMYFVFCEFEKTKEPITQEILALYGNKINKLIKSLSIALVVLVLIAFGFFFSLF